MQLLQAWLGIKEVELRGRARHVQMDDTFGARCVVQGRATCLGGKCRLAQQRVQGQRTQACTSGLQ
jgi:hypothetical protein